MSGNVWLPRQSRNSSVKGETDCILADGEPIAIKQGLQSKHNNHVSHPYVVSLSFYTIPIRIFLKIRRIYLSPLIFLHYYVYL